MGCLGGARFDHSLANLEVLQYILQHSGYGVMADSHTKVFLIAGSRLRLTEMKGATVSVFPYGTASCTVTYQGLLYPLAHDTLTSGGVLMGVSNTITAGLPPSSGSTRARPWWWSTRRNTFCPFGYTG